MDASGNFQQIAWIQKIFQDECWYEGERRHREVSPEDPIVKDKVMAIIISGAGQCFRSRLENDGQKN